MNKSLKQLFAVQKKSDVAPAPRSEAAGRVLGKPLDAAQLKQVAGGTALPVRGW